MASRGEEIHSVDKVGFLHLGRGYTIFRGPVVYLKNNK